MIRKIESNERETYGPIASIASNCLDKALHLVLPFFGSQLILITIMGDIQSPYAQPRQSVAKQLDDLPL